MSTTTPRGDLPAQLGRWVTVSNPDLPASWYGRLTALSDHPSLHLTAPGGQTVSLPQAFRVTPAAPPRPGKLAPAREAAYEAVYELLALFGPELPPDPVHRNAMIWRAVNTALDAAGVHVNADPHDPGLPTPPPPGDTTGDTRGHEGTPAPAHGHTPAPTRNVPARPHPEDTGDTSGDGVRFAYRATVRRNQVHAAITEAFDLLGAELAHPQHPQEADGRDA
ncbi:hypothetical protein AB0N20_27450 [Streptomyces griseoincarnatus]